MLHDRVEMSTGLWRAKHVAKCDDQNIPLDRLSPPSEHDGLSAPIKSAFQRIVRHALAALSLEQLRLRIGTPGQFGWHGENQYCPAVVESLVWGVSDAVQTKRREVDHELGMQRAVDATFNCALMRGPTCAWARFRPCLGPAVAWCLT